MQYDIDNAIEQVGGQAWDLKLKIGGLEWAVRPLQVADVDRLGQMGAQTRDQQLAAVRELFLEPGPSVQGWTSTQISHVVAAVIGYQRGRVLKNCQAVAAQVATAATRSE